MAKIRIYELARELGLESKDVLEAAREAGLEVKTASSGLDPEAAETLRRALAGGATSAETVAETPTDEAPAVEAAPAQPEPAEPQPEPEPEPVQSEPVQPEPAPQPARPQPEPVQPAPAPAAPAPAPMTVTVERGITPARFAELVERPVGEVVKALLEMGEMVPATAPIPEDALELLGEHFGHEVVVAEAAAADEGAPTLARPKRTFDDPEETLKPRPPVVTVMGHVDHGKTTLLDTIRRTRVAESEAGGITQHIGAYQVEVGGRKITFIDTPGHEAFTAMRARGAEVTDIVVLVVAADDGVMPQTVEAIDHAKAAGVPLIVAINKVDLPGADPARIRAQLTEHGVVVEELGGDVISVELSAKTGEGVDTLLEMIDLVAQLEDLKANPDAPASGVVIESRLDKGMGPVGTVIVQRGTLRQGDALVAGPVWGRVRAMMDEHGKRIKEAGPSAPALVMGWDEVPEAGEIFEVVENEKVARSIAQERVDAMRASELVVPTARERLEQLLEQLRLSDEAELRLIVKADTHGSLEAIKEAIGKITREGGRINIVHGAVGGITANDVSLAEVTESIIVGFNVRPDANARREAEAKGVEIRTYRIIYEMLEDIEQMLVGELAPEEVEKVVGAAEVRATFKTPKAGTIAGSYVTEGEVVRGARARLLRQGVVVYDGKISSLRRFKEDVRSVSAGYECGIGFENFNDVKEGDVIEVYEVVEVART